MKPSRLAVSLLLPAFLVAAGCSEEKGEPVPVQKLSLSAVGFEDLPGWGDDDPIAALRAFRRSCARLLSLPPERSLGADGLAGTVRDWAAACAAADDVMAEDAASSRAYFEARFRPFAATAGDEPDGLFTGYYEPELRGSRTRGGKFEAPLYRRPPDLVMVDLGQFRDNLRGERTAGRVVDGNLRPYESRAEIEAGALDGRGLELLWVDDPVDAFFLQIQGSGRVVLTDGTAVRVGYAGQNGHPYFAIGRDLIDSGALTREEVSLQSIRAWIEAHPEEGRALMQKNASYVFFREIAGDGPLGAQGVVLEPRRSLAVDRSFIPLGVPLWLVAESPERDGPEIRSLMIAQDTGGAIRGPVRGDLYWGAGAEAARMAGTMKATGRYYLLLPREFTARTGL